MSTTVSFPLTPIERQAKKHALLCSIGFLILLPIGVLVARYTRTWTNKWWYAHWLIQFVISGPVIFAGWAMGHKTTAMLQQPNYVDTHQKVGLTLLILYIVQLVLGTLVHFFKFPSTFRGHRAPHNYLHVLLGLAMLILAEYQVHYGLWIEWGLLGGLHKVVQACKNAWLALVIVFWGLYAIGMVFIPRQFKQERQSRAGEKNDDTSL